LSPNKNIRGFWNICNTILHQLGVPTSGPAKNTLTVLANLRNSFHSNGIHNNDSLNVNIDDTLFKFRRGKPVKCASWNHIVVIIRANISVLESVLLSNKVSNIKSEISDSFASANP
ncbi:MAG: hypothetical protein PVI26_11760, partial [Chitinispirillia bacterium]